MVKLDPLFFSNASHLKIYIYINKITFVFKYATRYLLIRGFT